MRLALSAHLVLPLINAMNPTQPNPPTSGNGPPRADGGDNDEDEEQDTFRFSRRSLAYFWRLPGGQLATAAVTATALALVTLAVVRRARRAAGGGVRGGRRGRG